MAGCPSTGFSDGGHRALHRSPAATVFLPVSRLSSASVSNQQSCLPRPPPQWQRQGASSAPKAPERRSGPGGPDQAPARSEGETAEQSRGRSGKTGLCAKHGRAVAGAGRRALSHCRGRHSPRTNTECPPVRPVTPGPTFFKPQTARVCGTNFNWERSSSVKSPPTASGDTGVEVAGRAVLGDGKAHSVPRWRFLFYKLCPLPQRLVCA